MYLLLIVVNFYEFEAIMCELMLFQKVNELPYVKFTAIQIKSAMYRQNVVALFLDFSRSIYIFHTWIIFCGHLIH